MSDTEKEKEKDSECDVKIKGKKKKKTSMKFVILLIEKNLILIDRLVFNAICILIEVNAVKYFFFCLELIFVKSENENMDKKMKKAILTQ